MRYLTCWGIENLSPRRISSSCSIWSRYRANCELLYQKMLLIVHILICTDCVSYWADGSQIHNLSCVYNCLICMHVCVCMCIKCVCMCILRHCAIGGGKLRCMPLIVESGWVVMDTSPCFTYMCAGIPWGASSLPSWYRHIKRVAKWWLLSLWLLHSQGNQYHAQFLCQPPKPGPLGWPRDLWPQQI